MATTRRLRWVVLTLSVIAALMLASCSVINSGPSYTERANFSQTIALFPGSFVRELGIQIGSVTKVVNQGDHVQVTMSIKRKYPLRPDASAVLVADSVLGERYVQFTPAYTGGPQLAPDSVIPIQQTAVPVETDQVLRSLNNVLSAINPQNAKDLVTNLADIVNGQGAKLNALIGNAAGTLQLLAAKSTDLGQLTDSLASLTGALRTRTSALASIIQDYDTVSQIIADDRQNVDATITNLTSATGQAAALLSTNLPGLKDDLSVLTTAGQTLDRNIDSLDVGLTNAPKLFSAAQRAYDPQHNWLPLNPALSATTTSAVLAARIRDSLAGVCRRLAVRTPSLAPALAACGNVNSGFFNAILNLIPGIISNLPGQTKTAGAAASSPARVKGAGAVSAAPADAMSAFADGLAAIPGLTAQERSALGGAPEASASAGLSSSSSADAMSASLAAFDPEMALGPPPVLTAAPTHHHHHGLFGGLWSWATNLVGSVL